VARRAGFTLLEVMVAVFVFAIVMGPLITMVQQNLARLGRSRMQTEAARLAEERLRDLELEIEIDGLPELGTEEGTFDPPNDMLRWVLSVEPFAIELPEEYREHANSSSVFANQELSSGASEPTLYRVIFRVFREDEETELIDPFVTLLVEPFDPNGLPEEALEALELG